MLADATVSEDIDESTDAEVKQSILEDKMNALQEKINSENATGKMAADMAVVQSKINLCKGQGLVYNPACYNGLTQEIADIYTGNNGGLTSDQRAEFQNYMLDKQAFIKFAQAQSEIDNLYDTLGPREAKIKADKIVADYSKVPRASLSSINNIEQYATSAESIKKNDPW